MKNILKTTRLVIREIDATADAQFMFELLNTPKFIKYIGDRGVRSADEAAIFIDDRYRKGYRDHGYGLYVVCLKAGDSQIGICGFVRRDSLPAPDLGFAFLPEHERKGYGYESAAAMMEYGRNTLGFANVYAITSPDNDASGELLKKLGFRFDGVVDMAGEPVKLFSTENLPA